MTAPLPPLPEFDEFHEYQDKDKRVHTVDEQVRRAWRRRTRAGYRFVAWHWDADDEWCRIMWVCDRVKIDRGSAAPKHVRRKK